jgi:uncharacterized coiled-coil DUF342 family protein
MNHTKIDDIMIEMITPKLTEIETKFTDGKPLTQEDINTLLLKSQYNHINHLDEKLDEVTADVASLKGEFNELKGEFSGLKGEFKLLESKVETKLESFEQKIELMIQKALNRNMMTLIIVMGMFLTLSKVIDKF